MIVTRSPAGESTHTTDIEDGNTPEGFTDSTGNVAPGVLRFTNGNTDELGTC